MTDNDWRNARIEEAYRHGRMDEKYSLAYAPPVFEKALGEATVTPTAHEVTTDEREAMARAVHAAIPGTGPWDDDAAERTSAVFQIGDRILAAGFRRTEVPEPSACQSCLGTCENGRHCCENCEHAEPQGDLSICECYRDGSEMVTCKRHTEPQGEPSDASTCEHCGGTSWHHAVECFTDAPSDAQEAVTRLENCLANREAGIGAWSMVRPEDVRTVLSALRAASEVR